MNEKLINEGREAVNEEKLVQERVVNEEMKEENTQCKNE